MHPTKVFAKAGQDNVTSAMCRHQQRFGLNVQCSPLVHNFNNIFSNGHLYRAGRAMKSPPSAIPKPLGTMFMKTVTLQTESYLFQNSDGQFRATPFYELSIDEWIVFENGQPKYLLDFNRRTKPLVQDLTRRLNNGEELDEAVQKLGRFLGRQWTTNHNIQGSEIPNSQQVETITVSLLDNLADLFMDVYFVATNSIDTKNP